MEMLNDANQHVKLRMSITSTVILPKKDEERIVFHIIAWPAIPIGIPNALYVFMMHYFNINRYMMCSEPWIAKSNIWKEERMHFTHVFGIRQSTRGSTSLF